MITDELNTARTRLRPFAASDAEEVFAGITPGLTRWMAWEPPPTPAAFAAIWREWLDSAEQRRELHWVARDHTEQCFLGLVAAHALDCPTPELGLWLRQDIHGQRFGHELIGAVVRWVGQHFPIDHFVYPVAEQNIASRRIAEAYGGWISQRRAGAKYPTLVYHLPPPRPART